MSVYQKCMNTTNKINEDQRWVLLEDLFNRHYLEADRTPTIIPPVIHQIWLGSEMPDESKKLRDEMMEINSNFEYKFWSDEDVDSFDLKNKELYYNINNLGARSDIFRYEILERLGGIYIDTDFKCVKPFDDLLYLDFWAGNGHISEPSIFNSIMASKPYSKFIQAIVNLEVKTFKDNIHGVMSTTGPYYISNTLFPLMEPEDKIVIFPTTFFFPFPAVYRHMKSERLINGYIKDSTYAVHLWDTSWQNNF